MWVLMWLVLPVVCVGQGMFRESWQLNTVPAANEGMQVRLALRGVATSVDEGKWCVGVCLDRGASWPEWVQLAFRTSVASGRRVRQCLSCGCFGAVWSGEPVRVRLEERLRKLEEERAAAAALAAEAERNKPPPEPTPEEQLDIDVCGQWRAVVICASQVIDAVAWTHCTRLPQQTCQ